ncbi:hypothetical protein DIS18_05065 [Algibacter marinivivus]|uniref:Por secretion system C-terminal sorting domain-containing protein n=1 Tax=Algibacter marinivivus TaxID=2100723 RepID=A0A2U2X7Y7_9FLAO|nr:carbohydrate binding domain-containing protein [Algibacter marinivivus]PWH83925.1 hypothetical protein DIS18_05065 [Algibacter marinivivus]
MKKITFLTFLLITSLGFSQNLLTNGDFETGVATPWGGNAANPVDDGSGSNYVNEANIMTAGNPWDVSLSQGDLSLVDGQTYTLSFDAYTATGTTRDIIAGIGQDSGAFSANTVTTSLTDAVTTFSYDLVANYGSAGAMNSRVVFDMGAETGFVFIDNVSLELVGGGSPTCTDGIQNGDETGVDCGGATCPSCPPAGSELLTNGDFDTGVAAPWGGNAANPVDDGSGNFVNEANIMTAGNPWDVSLSQGDLSLTDGASYTFSFDAYTATGTTRSMIVGIGQDTSPFDANTVTTSLTDVKTTFTYTLAANYGSAGSMNSRVIFDMGAETGFVFIDNVSLQLVVLDVQDAEKATFKTYPNPTYNTWTIKTDNIQIQTISVFDVLGKQVLSLSPNTSEVEVDASNLKSGLYFAQIKTATGIDSIKLIKK